MESGLIGYTGFVGSNLARQHVFDNLYNSKNFREMEGKRFSEAVCAGVYAVKWMANKEPEKDREKLAILQDVLKTVSAEQFVLISTIDVYPVIKNKDERFDCSSMDNHAYGTHRLEFEKFCLEHFKNCLIVRLPGLFGRGLKKNVIYDLLNDNCLEMINVNSSFQYYNLDNLWADIKLAMNAKLDVVNFFTEPVKTSDIIKRFFPGKKVGQNPLPEIHYDLHTRHGSLRGKHEDYLYTREEILDQLGEYVENYKGNRL
ncbi:hypothetical protein [Kaarinaea lacus]